MDGFSGVSWSCRAASPSSGRMNFMKSSGSISRFSSRSFFKGYLQARNPLADFPFFLDLAARSVREKHTPLRSRERFDL